MISEELVASHPLESIGASRSKSLRGTRRTVHGELPAIVTSVFQSPLFLVGGLTSPRQDFEHGCRLRGERDVTSCPGR